MKELINTKHFKASEFLISSTAKKLGIDNTPENDEIIDNLNWLIQKLEEVRVKFNGPIIVNSGYRCSKLNKAVGGASTSLHTKGMAADLKCKDNKKLFNLIKNYFDFDLLIDEYDLAWVHVSFKPNNIGNRHLILKIK